MDNKDLTQILQESQFLASASQELRSRAVDAYNSFGVYCTANEDPEAQELLSALEKWITHNATAGSKQSKIGLERLANCIQAKSKNNK